MPVVLADAAGIFHQIYHSTHVSNRKHKTVILAGKDAVIAFCLLTTIQGRDEVP